ncbi:UbiH/UbiF/VisC/COQ6 family ubiquinone biosynthesis hydroxylase [Steroidobacter sp. S1-65]|uniref:UbiH/UbiF/VisC/COQ6 family ubiquinone biosynthesis hydroxylase n=1 Tax=Steroidobacter gossypii TaxID=2805490 RepID=A0ABS1X5D5_9GAMM|nr:UbiH/UbiF/VisC/COQ6 family ubiquinone biosynthesis hydroxylase [Steroidobacter gossypii]MBM0108424.1 UbiH/UbiF/VisC/COQ6 family ubiquinone biosynthesis hydroxylase [Steroidobacter gossypii]
MKKTGFHILVIGGGLVGTCVAALAATHPQFADLRIAVLEAQPPMMPPPEAAEDIDLRVSAISRASERILREIGAWQLLPAQHVSAYDDMVVWDAEGKPRGSGSIHFSASESGEPNLGYIVENRRVLWSIYDSAAFRNRVTLLRGELTGLEFDEDHAAAILSDGRRIEAALIIGSDGSNSPSRKLAGIETTGWDYQQRAFVTHVRTQHTHARTAWQRFLPDGPIAYLPLADGRSSIVWTTTPEHAERLVAEAPEQVAKQLMLALDCTLGTVELAGLRGQFPLRLTHAKDYCRERFVLVGDAAHAIHPLAGQGVNLGFLDSAALVEVLADELDRGLKPTQLGERRVLRRYERWRKSENAVALGLVDGLNKLFGSRADSLGWARRAGLNIVDGSALAKRFLMGRALGTGGDAPALVRTHR